VSLVPVSIATEAYDRVLPLRDERVKIQGCDPTFLTIRHEELFLRAFHHEAYDICELSMSSYLTSISLGQSAYIAVPVFLSRLFRHSAIYTAEVSGISKPADLIGKRIGVPEYQITAALWVRGLLEDEYGVHPGDLAWFRGGLHEPARVEKLPLALPEGIVVTDINPQVTLDQMLVRGEIDALISPRVPMSFIKGNCGVQRLFPDYRSAEEDYFARTGVFPIMHVLALRRALVAQFRWLPGAVYDAFCAAKNCAIEAFSDVSALRVTLPWFAAELEATRQRMGGDFWPYGVAPNRRAITLMLDYAFRHGTIGRKLSIDDIFVPETISGHPT
jgi:4,5-dihydroxyphthalate decarboxylase